MFGVRFADTRAVKPPRSRYRAPHRFIVIGLTIVSVLASARGEHEAFAATHAPPRVDADNARPGGYGWFEGGHRWQGEFADPEVVYDNGTYYAYSSGAGGRYLGIQTSTELPNTRASVAYSGQVVVVNGNFTPLNFTISAGALPSGLVLNPSTGAITGSAQGTAGQYNFTVSVADAVGQTASRSYAIGLGSVAQITTTSVPQGTTGAAYSTTFSQTGANAPTWTNPGGGLPKGLTLSSNGCLTGTVRQTGLFTFTAQATDSGAPPQIASRSLTFL